MMRNRTAGCFAYFLVILMAYILFQTFPSDWSQDSISNPKDTPDIIINHLAMTVSFGPQLDVRRICLSEEDAYFDWEAKCSAEYGHEYVYD